jgi:hypothetical protein
MYKVYRGDDFSVLGLFVSYAALKFLDINLRLQIALRYQVFDDADSFVL